MNSAVVPDNAKADATATTPELAYPPLPIADDGQVRLGGQAPLFSAAVIADSGLVRLGGQSPMFR